MIIPGQLIAVATFPGVIVHEAAHFFFCRLFKLAVFDVCYFRVASPAGYVVHEDTNNFNATFFISLGPFFINTLLCILFCSAAFPVWEFSDRNPLTLFFYWLGLSIGMHAIPSTADLRHVWERLPSAAKRGNPLALLGFPVVVLLFPLNTLRVVWADLWYGIAVGLLLPIAVLRVLV